MGSAIKSVGNMLGIGGKGGGGPGGNPTVDQKKFNVQPQVDERTKQSRAASMGLMADLQKQARGEAPSLAEAQLKSATSRNLAQTLAAAAAGRGSNPALVQRNVLQAKSAGDRAAAEQSAIARMQEQQVAQQQLQSLALNQQTQDLQQVMSPADLAARGEELRFGGDVARRNQVRAEQNALLGGVMNAGASFLASDEKLKAPTDGKGINLTVDPETALKTQTSTPSDRFNSLVAKLSQGQSAPKFDFAPSANGMFAPKGPSPEAKSMISGASATNSLAANPELLSVLAASDKQNKTKVTNPKADMKDFLNKLEARAYEYKDASLPGTAPGQRYGVMAQDLEKSKVGKTLVKNTPAGKMVDTTQGFGAVLAAQAELNERLKKLEKKGKA